MKQLKEKLAGIEDHYEQLANKVPRKSPICVEFLKLVYDNYWRSTFFLLTLFLSSPLSLFFLLSLSLLSSPLSLFFLLSLSLLSSSLSHSSFSCPFFFLSFIHLCFVSFSLLSSLSFFFSPRTYSSLPTIYCFAHGKRNYWYIICMLWIQQAQFSVLILKFWS